MWIVIAILQVEIIDGEIKEIRYLLHHKYLYLGLRNRNFIKLNEKKKSLKVLI